MIRNQPVPENWPGRGGVPWEWIRKIALCVNGLLLGKSNNVRDVTLTAGATTTTITDPRITPDTMAILEPLTASAVTARATLRQAASPGSLVLTHANSAATDQNFKMALVG